MNGCKIKCDRCDGHGIVQNGNNYDPCPEECADCNGSGNIWRYNSGVLAKYYGGPLIGKDVEK